MCVFYKTLNMLWLKVEKCKYKRGGVMDAQDLRKLLEQTDDKLSIFSNIETLDTQTLSEFFVEHKEFFNEKEISPYEIIRKLDVERQKEFVTNIENLNFTLNEKREILATLNADIKPNIDTTNFPEEYKVALSIQTTKYRRNYFRLRKKFRRLSWIR